MVWWLMIFLFRLLMVLRFHNVVGVATFHHRMVESVGMLVLGRGLRRIRLWTRLLVAIAVFRNNFLLLLLTLLLNRFFAEQEIRFLLLHLRLCLRGNFFKRS